MCEKCLFAADAFSLTWDAQVTVFSWGTCHLKAVAAHFVILVCGKPRQVRTVSHPHGDPGVASA